MARIAVPLRPGKTSQGRRGIRSPLAGATLTALVALGGAIFLLVTSPSLLRAGLEPIPDGPADLANGRHVFFAGGCAECHATPKQADKMRLGGGLALNTPFGTFYPPNISPHRTDGIGGWTPQQFFRAIRGGVAPDGRHYYPAFPYTSYQRMTATDARDLFGYINTLQPVEGRAPDHALAFPFTVRRGLGLWKLLFLDGRPFEPDLGRSAAWNRGAYLVEALGHCAECHSPRNLFGAIPADRRFSGGPNPEGKGWVPNITPDKTGTGEWEKADIVEVLTTGLTPEGDFVGAQMAAVKRNTSQLPQEDRESMAEYILSLPPRPGRKRGK